MTKKFLSVAVAAVIGMTAFTGCSSKQEPSTKSSNTAPSGTAPAKQMVLRLAENQSADYPTTIGDKEFAKLVEERSNGRIKIEVYHGGQLGQEKAVIEQVQFGAIDFARVNASPMAEFSKKLNVLSLPYLFRSSDHLWKVLDGQIGDDLLSSLGEAKFTGLAFYDSGARSFYNTKKEVKSVADMKGLKIRVQESKLMMGMISALGATPTAMAYGEVYSALQTGVIDGAENNWPSYVSTSHYEVAKNITLDEHSRVPEVVIASKMVMDKLSKEDQDLIKKAAKDSVKVQKEAWANEEKKAQEKAKSAGVKITVVDEATKAEFQKAMSSLYDEFGKDYKDIIEKIKAVK